MRMKFFLSTFFTLAFTLALVSWIHFRFFRTERLRLIDQQVEVLAGNILSSDLSSEDMKSVDLAETVITDALGDDRLFSFIRVLDAQGNTLYRNSRALLIDAQKIKPMTPWQTIDNNGHSVRLLSFETPDHLKLQIGLFLDQGQIRWQTLSTSVFLYLAGLLSIVLLASWLMMRFIMAPLSELAANLETWSAHLARGDSSKLEEIKLSIGRKSRSRRVDEFFKLHEALLNFVDRVRSQFRINHRTSAQMAHELKTPLTVLQNMLEPLARAKDTQNLQIEATQEIQRLNRVIDAFLSWSSIENEITKDSEIFAVKIEALIDSILSKLEGVYPARFKKLGTSQLTAFARPEWVEQALMNLLDNAAKYADPATEIQVELFEQSLRISNSGPTVPAHVLEHLGEPFNKGGVTGENLRSTGLGLAWVVSLARIYRWTFKMQSQNQQTQVELHF